MTVKNTITQKLNAAFHPQHLDVVDESHLHAGHAGHREGGETHFRLHIISDAFTGKNRIDRQRLVNDLLADDMGPNKIHALAMKVEAPGES